MTDRFDEIVESVYDSLPIDGGTLTLDKIEKQNGLRKNTAIAAVKQLESEGAVVKVWCGTVYRYRRRHDGPLDIQNLNAKTS